MSYIIIGTRYCTSFDSSVGRAVDCSGNVIHRSLVRIRLEGLSVFFSLFFLFIPPQSQIFVWIT